MATSKKHKRKSTKPATQSKRSAKDNNKNNQEFGEAGGIQNEN